MQLFVGTRSPTLCTSQTLGKFWTDSHDDVCLWKTAISLRGCSEKTHSQRGTRHLGVLEQLGLPHSLQQRRPSWASPASLPLPMLSQASSRLLKKLIFFLPSPYGKGAGPALGRVTGAIKEDGEGFCRAAETASACHGQLLLLGWEEGGGQRLH